MSGAVVCGFSLRTRGAELEGRAAADGTRPSDLSPGSGAIVFGMRALENVAFRLLHKQDEIHK